MSDIENLRKYFRAANYISVAQIFLQDNYLLEDPLKPEHIKPRLLGHWGTCPGISFVYAFLNKLIKDNDADIMYVVGPGHGYPAVQANLFLEDTLSEYYPEAKRDSKGIEYISKNFSWPYGFPSHSSPHTPGVILEGGELGYALSTSFGSVLDNPDLITACLIGDGEAETGPTATAWHCNKFINPKTDGAVLPILHLNGYKISGPTIFGRMSDKELKSLFEGYGYEPHFVEEKEDDNSQDGKGDAFEQMNKVMSKAYAQIKKIQDTARKEGAKPVKKPKWPMIVLRSPKGWTGPEMIGEKKVEGNHFSHQVVVGGARSSDSERLELEKWLHSYKFEELFDEENGFIQEIKDSVPQGNKRVGKSKHAFGGPEVHEPLNLPDVHQHEEDVPAPGTIGSSSMRRAGEYMNSIFELNSDSKNFRFFSPDETYSNKLDKVFDTVKRSFVWPLEKWDDDISNEEGRVMEMLSEHTLQGMMQGYVLTGRHGIFASYEAFIQIVVSMADQYAKFLRQAKEVAWRGTIPSFNYILTSSGWRQEHNGFSHQNPGFIDNVLQRQGDFVNVYFPPDGNSTIAVMEKMMEDANGINVLIAGKRLEPRWLDVNQAKDQLEEGIGIWKFASDEDPDIVFATMGDYPTNETMAAIQLLKKELPEVKIRMVNVMSMSHSGFGCGGCVLAKNDFNNYFTEDKPVIFNYHGYPQTIKQILFDYSEKPGRFKVNGYLEEGSTTTPFDMQVRNKISRYNLIQDVCEMIGGTDVLSEEKAKEVVDKYDEKLREHKEYIKKHGVDPDEIEDWVWDGARVEVESE